MFLAATQQPTLGNGLRQHIQVATPRVYFRGASGAEYAVNDTQQPVLLTVPEAANMLRISKWTLYSRFINTRRLETIQVGSRRLVPLDAVHALIKSLRADEAL